LLSSTGRRWGVKIGRVLVVGLAAACASSSDAVPPVSIPEPLAIMGPQATAPRQRTVEPSTPARASLPVRAPVRRAARPARVAQPERPPSPAAPRTRAHAPVKVPLDSAALERSITKRFAYEPLSLALARRTRKTELADRIAAAVVYEAERNRISPSLLAAVLLIENAPFDTTAISSQGAIGLMQVMPVHIGSYGCPSGDLNSVEANICHGARILHTYIRRAKSVPLALKRYNGCVRGRNTPRCHRYPGRVLRVASKLRHEMLVQAAGFEGGVPDDVALTEAGNAVSVPSHPVLDPDTTTTTTTTSASECTTFVGCLKNRWSSR
jgi:soluble lytic murein transglycosylase-like protein